MVVKAYQVFKGELDKHDKQQFELVATYLSRDRAMEHCEKIVKEDPDGKDAESTIREKYAVWLVKGWYYVDICKMEEITITE